MNRKGPRSEQAGHSERRRGGKHLPAIMSATPHTSTPQPQAPIPPPCPCRPHLGGLHLKCQHLLLRRSQRHVCIQQRLLLSNKHPAATSQPRRCCCQQADLERPTTPAILQISICGLRCCSALAQPPAAGRCCAEVLRVALLLPGICLIIPATSPGLPLGHSSNRRRAVLLIFIIVC
jgi:hypothetical protein